MARNIRVNVKMNYSKLNKLSRAQIQALEMTADAVKTDIMTSGVTPKQTGELERSAFIDSSKIRRGLARIVYNTPYARRLYWHPEYRFRTDKNTRAQGRWLDPWIRGDKKDFAKRAFKKFYKAISGGVVK